ncbi:hypothetical protein ACWEPN_27400 [Nonomuraea wenchangensis]
MTLTAGLVVAAAPAATAADSMTDLGVSVGNSDNTRVVAGGDKVFVATADRVLVAGTDGVLLGSITGLAGVKGLVATPDGAHAYAALPDSNEVVELDATALTVTRRIDLAAAPCPTELMLSGETLWVAHACEQFHAGLARLDLSDAAAQPVAILTEQDYLPTFAASGNTLLLSAPASASADVLVYDVSTGSAVLRGEIDGDIPDTNAQPGVAITPDGSTAVLAYRSAFESWDLESLTKLRDYGKDSTAQGRVNAFAISSDGGHIASGFWLGDRGVELYDVATGATTYTRKIPSEWPTPRIRSMAIADNHVFSVLYSSFTTNLRLWRLEDATLLPSTLTVSAPEGAMALELVTLAGRLTLPEGMTPGLQSLEVTRRHPDGTRTTLDPVETEADGTFSITDAPPVSGKVSYDVSWRGSTTVRGSTASTVLDVGRLTSSLTVTGPTSLVLGDRLTFGGTLKFDDQAAPAGTSLTVLRGNPDGTSTNLGTVQVSGTGSFQVSDLPDQEGENIYNVDFDGNDAATSTTNALFVMVRAGGI